MIDLHDTAATASRLRIGRWRPRLEWMNPSGWPPYWWVWACGAFAIVGMLTANLVFMSQFRRAALDDARHEVVKLVRVNSEAADRILRSVDFTVLTLSARLSSIPSGNGAPLVSASGLATRLAAMPQLAALGVIDADGTLVASAGDAAPAAAAYLSARRRNPALAPLISAPAQDPRTGDWSIFWARPVTAVGGRFAGAVVAAVRLKYFDDFFAASAFGGGGAVSLWRDDGTLLARDPPVASAATRAERDGFDRLAGAGAPRYVRIATPTGLEPAIAVRRQLHDYPLAVTVAMTKSAALAQWHREAPMIGAAAIARVIVIGLIVLLVRRHLMARDQVAAARSEIDTGTTACLALEQAVARSEVAIREHERAEAALRESEQRFRDVSEVAADVIWETGPDHRFTFFSGGSANELRSNIGFEIPQLLGKTRWELGGGDPVGDPVWRDHKAELDAHRQFRQFRYAVVSRAGAPVYYSVNGKPVFDASGRFAGYRGVATNETRIIEARSRAERAETLLSDAVESISEGFVIYDKDDRLALCNEAFLKLYPSNRKILVPGTRFEDILREGLERGLYAEAIGREEEWLATRMEQHRNPQGPIEAKHSSGRWLLICERPMRDGGIAGLRIDITAMKAAQTAMRASEERLNRAQRLARMGCDSRDLRTDEREWSDETYRIFGVTRENFVPTTERLLAMVHPDDRAIILKSRSEAARGVRPAPTEFRIVRPDNTIRYVARESELVCDETGVPTLVAGTVRDITDLRASQARQKELERQLQRSQKMKALGTLAGGIAHDLNNTLVPILSLSKLVAERMPAGSDDREDLETIVFASERARDLLQQILMFSRNQASARERIDLAALTRKALQMVRVTVPAAVRLVEEIAAVPPISGDGGQLQRVVVNLLSNSIQAIGSRPGTVTVAVAVAVAPPGDGEPEPDAVLLAVADTGCGMDAATVERIFEPFYTTKRVGEGTGLGLAVVHGIVADHGGRIEVDSERGKGTVFRIVLPMSGEDAAPASKTPLETSPKTASKPAGAAGRNGKKAVVPA